MENRFDDSKIEKKKKKIHQNKESKKKKKNKKKFPIKIKQSIISTRKKTCEKQIITIKTNIKDYQKEYYRKYGN